MPRRVRRATLRCGLLLGCLSGCGVSSAVVATAPDTYVLSEERAPVLGGGPAARRLVLARAERFCRQQGRADMILELRPDGDPFTPYWPTAYDVTFRCPATDQPPGNDLP